jgi:hypothetical protein
VSLPSKPSGFDSYGQTFGVYIFTTHSATSTSSSYMAKTCGVWSYNSAPWGSSCSFDKSALASATTYYARYYLEDSQGRASWSSAQSFTVSAPALPSFSAPSNVSVGSSIIVVSLPSKPSGFDNYGQTMGVYIFSNSFATGTSSSYMEQTCGSWSYNSAPWNGTCSFNKTALSSGTYYARYYLTDNQNRTDWSSTKSFTVSAPALPSLSTPSSVTVGSSTISVSLPSKPSGFDAYGQTMGVYIFSASWVTGTSSSYMEQTCGNYSYSAAPWGSTCSFNKTALSSGTYYARYYLTDNQGRSDWSSARSFTVLPPTTTTTTTAPPNQEQQAALKGQSYLDLSAFSRSGLIDQLEYEGFTTAQATAGVDSLSVDWNAQAVQSGQSYLDLSAFSRSGLIGQLEYEGFTTAQATHAVNQLAAQLSS